MSCVELRAATIEYTTRSSQKPDRSDELHESLAPAIARASAVVARRDCSKPAIVSGAQRAVSEPGLLVGMPGRLTCDC